MMQMMGMNYEKQQRWTEGNFRMLRSSKPDAKPLEWAASKHQWSSIVLREMTHHLLLEITLFWCFQQWVFSAPNQRLASSKASVGVWSSSIWMPWSRGFSNPSPGLWLEEACRSWRKWPANVGQDPRSAWMIVRCWEMRCPMNPKLGSGRWMKNGPNGWG